MAVISIPKALRDKLGEEATEALTDVIKWMFIFWTVQIGAIIGILFTFFK